MCLCFNTYLVLFELSYMSMCNDVYDVLFTYESFGNVALDGKAEAHHFHRQEGEKGLQGCLQIKRMIAISY